MNTFRSINLFGYVDWLSAKPVLAALDQLGKGDTLAIRICSPGGFTDSGYAIIDAIRSSDARVVTIGTGDIGSVATDILVAGDWRIATPLCIAMTHRPSVSGKMSKSRRADILRLENWRGAKLFMDRTKFKTEEALHAALFGRADRYWNADQLLDMGMIDAIASLK